jgi:hypothetical protein
MGAERFPCSRFGNFDKKNQRFHSQYLVSLFQSRITTTLNISIWSNFSSRDDYIFLNEHYHHATAIRLAFWEWSPHWGLTHNAARDSGHPERQTLAFSGSRSRPRFGAAAICDNSGCQCLSLFRKMSQRECP